MSKVIHNIEEYGNTSAGSIPLALFEAVKQGKIKKGMFKYIMFIMYIM